MEFVILTGMSGAGKSQAIKILEDIGYYCMDNLPPTLLPNFAELCNNSTKVVNKVAVVADIRGGIFFDDLFKSLDILKNKGLNYRILYLDSNDDELVKRYKEQRRPHPLSISGRIIDGIQKERVLLKEVKQKSDYIIDTSNMKLGRLKEEIHSIFIQGKFSHNLNVTIISFGYKYGIPLDSDLVFDVRFLPNPYYISNLKDGTGNDLDVQNYVMSFEATDIFIEKTIDLLDFLMPQYKKEGKSNIVISIGCTGGRHRSVTIANKIADLFREKSYRVLLTHRDIDK